MLYLDTSLLVSALTNEPRTAETQNWLAEQPPEQLTISDWVITEFSGALSLKLRNRQLSTTNRADALAMFTTLTEASFSVLPLSRLESHTAARFADQYTTGLRSGDALHLAVAANHGLKLCSLDHGLVQAAETLGVSVVAM